MCFTSKNYKTKKEVIKAINNPKIAKKDIPVYKILTMTGFSSYKKMKYKKGFRYTEKELGISINTEKILDISINTYINEYYFVGNKGLHAYTKQQYALRYKIYNEEIIKMYIPKGSAYYESEFGKEIFTTDLVWY